MIVSWYEPVIQGDIRTDIEHLGMTGGGLRVKKSSNVIIRNLYMHDPPTKDDLIQIQYSTYVWVDHCDLSTDGLVGSKDYYDGLLDIQHVC